MVTLTHTFFLIQITVFNKNSKGMLLTPKGLATQHDQQRMRKKVIKIYEPMRNLDLKWGRGTAGGHSDGNIAFCQVVNWKQSATFDSGQTVH